MLDSNDCIRILQKMADSIQISDSHGCMLLKNAITRIKKAEQERIDHWEQFIYKEKKKGEK